MAVTRSGPCLPSGSSCNQRFRYGWDEVGRLVRAQRWDTATAVSQEPTGTLAVDLAYAYDASDNRVLKSAKANEGPSGDVQRHAVYISGGQELRGAKFEAQYGTGGVADYQLDSATEVAYLFAHGMRLGRVAHDTKAGTSDGMPLFNAINPLPQQHVLINLDDTLGSTAIVIDRATGELVESTAYLANGATESDYRAERWKGLREDYRFTGKEEDVEVGLQYFGKRFLSPYLGRWVSADPLAVHVPDKADWNLYAYVRGAVLKAVDPLGLQDLTPTQAQSTANEQQTPVRNGEETYIPEMVIKSGADSSDPLPLADDINWSAAGEWQENSADAGSLRTFVQAPTPAAPRSSHSIEKPLINALVGSLPPVQVLRMTSPNPPDYRVYKDADPGMQAVFEFGIGMLGSAAIAPRIALRLPAVGDDIGWAAAKGNPIIEVRPPTLSEGVEVADALAWERRALEAARTGGGRNRAAAVVGRYDPSTQEAAAFSSRPGRHAEGVAKDNMPDGVFSKPIDVRRGSYKNVCPPCQAEHGRAAFPDGTGFD